MQKRIKVIRVVTSPEVVEYHLRNTLNELSKYPEFDFEIVGTEVSRYRPLWPNVRFTDIKIERKIRLFSDFLAVFKLTWHLFKSKPDVVHSIMPKAALFSALAAYVARVPIRVHTFTGQVWAQKTGFKRKIFIWLDQMVVFLNTACLTDSPSQSIFLLNHGVGGSGKPIPALGKGSLCGVDLKRLNANDLKGAAAKIRRQYGIGEKDVVFVSIARKFRDKGVFELIEAFHKLYQKRKNCYLMLVGPDDSSEFTEFFKSAPKEHVISEGHTQTPEIFLAASDILCLPSYREGFGSVVIDAGAMGLPTIATRIPGLVDAVEENVTGVLVGVKDVLALETAMDQLYLNEELRKKLGLGAQARARKYFSSEQLAEELFDFYRKQVGNEQKAP